MNAFGCRFAVASKPVDTNDTSDPDLTAVAFRARLMFSGFDKPKTETFFGQLLSPQVADITELPPTGFKCKTNWSYFISINRGVSRGGERLLYVFMIVLPYKVAHPTGDGAEHLYQLVMSQDIFSPTEWDSVKRKGVDVGIAIFEALIK